MKFTAITAMIIVGLDCTLKGLGIESQTIFAAGHEWFWYFAAFGWFSSAITGFWRLEVNE